MPEIENGKENPNRILGIFLLFLLASLIIIIPYASCQGPPAMPFPANLRIVTAGGGQVTLAWDPVTDPNLAGYRIYYGNNPFNYNGVFSVSKDFTTFTIVGLNIGVTYYFALTYYDSLGNESNFSLASGVDIPSDFMIAASSDSHGTVSCIPPHVASGGSSTCTIAPATGYHTVNVLVDGVSVGTPLSYLFGNVMANYTISATFASNSYTLTVTKAGIGSGSVTPSTGNLNWAGNIGTADYDFNTPVTLTAQASPGSTFYGWSEQGCSGTGPCTVTIDSNKAVTATFSDIQPPITSGRNPDAGATTVSVDTNIVVHVKDTGSGVNQSTIVMTVGGSAVSPVITGTPADYTLTYDPPTNFNFNQQINVTVSASDLAGNVMAPDSYSFLTVSQAGNVWPNFSSTTLFIKPMKERENANGTAIFPPVYDYWPEFYNNFLPDIKAVFAKVNIEVVAIGDPNNPYLPMSGQAGWDNYNPATDPNHPPCDIMRVVYKASKEYVATPLFDHNHGHTWFYLDPGSGAGCWEFDSLGYTPASEGIPGHKYKKPEIYPFTIENYRKEGAYPSIASGETPVGAAQCSAAQCCVPNPNNAPLAQYYNYCGSSPMNIDDDNLVKGVGQPDGTVEINKIQFNVATKGIAQILGWSSAYNMNRVTVRTIIHEMGHALLAADDSDHCTDSQCIMNPNPEDWELYDFGHGSCIHMPSGSKDIRKAGIIHNTVH